MLGTLLRPRRAGLGGLAWNRANLAGPDCVAFASPQITDGGEIDLVHVARRIGGGDLSPGLFWSVPPPATEQLLLVIEDVDSPTASPFIHCVALLDPSRGDDLPTGALSSSTTFPGIRVLRSSLGIGYRGPGPMKGHGLHRYHFELFALASPIETRADGRPIERAKPRVVLGSITASVLGRGRFTGVFGR